VNTVPFIKKNGTYCSSRAQCIQKNPIKNIPYTDIHNFQGRKNSMSLNITNYI